MGRSKGRRKMLRHGLYKVIAVLLVLNAMKWIGHPFGLNLAQHFNGNQGQQFVAEDINER